MQKNKIILIAISIILAAPSFAENEAELNSFVPPAQEQAVSDFEIEQSTQNSLDDQTQNFSNQAVSPYKQPAGKKQTAKKFLMAMFGVVASSVLIYVLLTVYNKIRSIFNISTSESSDFESSLETPKNIEDAVKTFLDKTKW